VNAETLAQAALLAYERALGGQTGSWKYLGPAGRAAWKAAVQAAIDAFLAGDSVSAESIREALAAQEPHAADELDALRADLADAEAEMGRWPRCSSGCRCRVGTEDADVNECGCDGPCTSGWEPQSATGLTAGSVPSDVRPRADGRRGLDITCGSCGEDYGTNVTDLDEIECVTCEARRCPHCQIWFGGNS